MSEIKFAKGIYFDKPRDGAPEFVRGRMSIKAEDAIAMLNEEKNERGYVNFELLRSKDGQKLYFTVNDWKPEKKEDKTPDYPREAHEGLAPADVPF